jgi:hypothetical protein
MKGSHITLFALGLPFFNPVANKHTKKKAVCPGAFPYLPAQSAMFDEAR